MVRGSEQSGRGFFLYNFFFYFCAKLKPHENGKDFRQIPEICLR